ncbi:MAG: hypothetical protein M3Y80_03780, partial [Verrucomicrobiota bacterium]|nr:hypothetical protein [Verrucomicrobiota bacterium]
MRRLAVCLFLAVMAALGIWFGLRGKGPGGTGTAVTALLPAETVAFVHLPDFSRTRAEWHESDLYKLWREPAVQEFLQKPLSASLSGAKAQEMIGELEQLGIKDAFLAVTSWEGDQLRLAGGFRFKGSARDAEKIIGRWRPNAPASSTEATRQVLSYRGRQIDVVTQNGATIATAYDGSWFFAANDVQELQALLDRATRHASNGPTLQGEPNFAAALRHLPGSYALAAYARVAPYIERLTKTLPPDSPAAVQLQPLRQVRSISMATAFENGKVRDELFVAMPQQTPTPTLTRSSLALGTPDTFLYIASVLALPSAGPVQNANAAGISLPVPLQRALAAFTGNGLTAANVEAAFGPEISLIGDWPANARMPALFASLPV